MVAAKKVKKKSAKAAKAGQMKSFRLYPNEKPFVTNRVNQQTFYWVIIGVLVVTLGASALILSARLQSAYDKMDVTVSESHVR